jgi:hypothetical protein
MPRFLIEVSQPEDRAEKRIAESIRSTGSHFAAGAAWCSRDGVCVGTMVVEAGDWRHAAAVVPPALRGRAQVHRLAAMAA